MISFSCRLSRPSFALDAGFTSPGGCLALFGPSGSGKTTVAKLIAGLETPDAGRVVVGDRVLVDTDQRIRVPVHQRRVGFVFQDGQLLPHLSVRQNLEYGRSFSAGEPGVVTFDAIVDLLGIGHLLEARPATLSGGERQRVAIGRAMLAAPRILVMDEPLASLDAERKLEILPFIERLRDELNLPMIYVSHAVGEVARLASKVVRLSQGRVVAEGTPADVFATMVPASAAERFELVSFLSGVAVRQVPEFAMTVLGHPAGEITLPGRLGRPGAVLRVAVQATNVTLATEAPRGLSVRTVLKGRIKEIASGEDASAVVTIELEGGDRLSALLTRLAVAELGLAPGRNVYALVKAVAIDERAIASI
jgi:molybdate transport system ATP-binding protein